MEMEKHPHIRLPASISLKRAAQGIRDQAALPETLSKLGITIEDAAKWIATAFSLKDDWVESYSRAPRKLTNQSLSVRKNLNQSINFIENLIIPAIIGMSVRDKRPNIPISMDSIGAAVSGLRVLCKWTIELQRLNPKNTQKKYLEAERAYRAVIYLAIQLTIRKIPSSKINPLICDLISACADGDFTPKYIQKIFERRELRYLIGKVEKAIKKQRTRS